MRDCTVFVVRFGGDVKKGGREDAVGGLCLAVWGECGWSGFALFR